MTRPVLVLRPEPGASRTRAAAEAAGLRALSIPLFELAPVAWFPPDPARFDAIMFTSAAALDHGGPDLRRFRALPAYAVGAATAEAARAAGFAVAHAGDADATALAAALAADGVMRVLHPCGADRREAAAPGVAIERVTVYEARPVARPEGLNDALQLGPVAMLHSPRAAARLAELTGGRSWIALAAISEAAAAAAGAGWRTVAVAAKPDDAALLAVAARLCEDCGDGDALR